MDLRAEERRSAPQYIPGDQERVVIVERRVSDVRPGEFDGVEAARPVEKPRRGVWGKLFAFGAGLLAAGAIAVALMGPMVGPQPKEGVPLGPQSPIEQIEQVEQVEPQAPVSPAIPARPTLPGEVENPGLPGGAPGPLLQTPEVELTPFDPSISGRLDELNNPGLVTPRDEQNGSAQPALPPRNSNLPGHESTPPIVVPRVVVPRDTLPGAAGELKPLETSPVQRVEPVQITPTPELQMIEQPPVQLKPLKPAISGALRQNN